MSSTTLRAVEGNTHLDDSLVVLVRARVRARERAECEEDYFPAADEQAINQYWRATIGSKLPESARYVFLELYMCHIEPQLILAVIDRVAEAPRPSWAYAAAIFKRLREQMIFTVADWEEDNRKFRERRKTH